MLVYNEPLILRKCVQKVLKADRLHFLFDKSFVLDSIYVIINVSSFLSFAKFFGSGLINRLISSDIQHPGKKPSLSGIIRVYSVPDLKKNILQNFFCKFFFSQDTSDNSKQSTCIMIIQIFQSTPVFAL